MMSLLRNVYVTGSDGLRRGFPEVGSFAESSTIIYHNGNHSVGLGLSSVDLFLSVAAFPIP